MAAKIPDMKFDKDQTAWARWAQQEITEMKQRLNAKDQDDLNSNQGMKATLNVLGGQVQAVTQLVATAIVPAAVDDYHISGFGLTLTPATVGSVSIPIPVGYTRAVLLAVVQVMAKNSTVSADYLVSYGVQVNGTLLGAECDSYTPAGILGNAISTYSTTLTNLTGTSITLSGLVGTGTGTWAASGQNLLVINATAIFLL